MYILVRVTIAAGILIISSFANATIYKCTSASGEIAFQQVPCADKESSEQVKIRAQPTKADIAAAHARTHPEEYKGPWPNQNESIGYGGKNESAVRTEPSSRSARQSSESTGGGHCPAGQAPLNASRLDPSRGWSDSKGYVPLRCSDPNRQATESVVRTGPGYTEPETKFDQYGNVYSKAPGSPVFIDTKTGRPCVANGSTIVHCN